MLYSCGASRQAAMDEAEAEEVVEEAVEEAVDAAEDAQEDVADAEEEVEEAADAVEMAARLVEGKLLYEQHCQSCHKLKDPADYTVQELKQEVPEMVEKANNKKGAGLTESQGDNILAFLLSMKK